MERLVLELKSLNFQQLNVEKHKPICGSAHNSKQQSLISKSCASKMSTSEHGAQQIPPSTSLNADNGENVGSVSASSDDNSEEGIENDVIDTIKTEHFSSIQRGGINFRKLPHRSTKEDRLHSKNLRTSMKPSKLNPKTTEKLRPAQIKKLYTNKKLTNFRPTSLETIFEEPQPMHGGGGGEQFRLVGVKKLRRTLVCSDGLKPNKAIVNRRRAKIKKNLGRRATWKKIPLQNFLSYMQSSLSSENEEEHVTSDKLETNNEYTLPLKTANEVGCFEMDLADESESIAKSLKC